MALVNATDKYSRGLEEKLRLLEAFEQETDYVKYSLHAGEVDRLNIHLKKRQKIVDKVSRLDKEMERLTQAGGFSIEDCSRRIQQEMAGYFKRIKDTLKSISDLDEECRTTAQTQRDDMKREILRIRHGVTVARRYDNGCQAGPKFLDVRR